MVGLCKAFFALLLQLAWAEWGPVQEWYGRLWRQHGPTGYWAETTEAGLLMHNEDHDWLEGWCYDPPPPVLVPNPLQPANDTTKDKVQQFSTGLVPQVGWPAKGPRLPSINERDDIGFGGGRASTDPPRPPTPPRPSRCGGGGGGGRGPAAPDRLPEALGQVSEMLNQEQPEKRYEKKGFRAAIRRQLKKLCNRYQLR